MLKNSFKILIIFILIFNTFASSAMAANQPYDHNALLEYDGYGEAMYDTIVKETTFFTGQYTDNKEYVSKSIDQISDYANFWKQEAVDMWNTDTLRDAIERGGGYLLTVGDWFKKLFNDYTDDNEPPVYEDIYSQFVTKRSDGSYIVNNGYKLIFNEKVEFTNSSGSFILLFDGSWDAKNGGNVRAMVGNIRLHEPIPVDGDVLMSFLSPVHINDMNFTQAFTKLKSVFPVTLRIVTETNGSDVTPSRPVSPPTIINKYIQDNFDDDTSVAIPEPRPYLVCPNGTKIQMSISGSTFLGADGKAMIVNKDGTANVDSSICKLGWDKPTVKYDDDGRAVMDTAEGNWVLVETGKGTDGNGGYQCVENGVVVPCKEIEKPDGSLLAYVKNAYEYATGYLETAVNGLKSLGSGAVGVTALYKIFFGWLPQEIVVLMTSGLAIMLGLRIFRK